MTDDEMFARQALETLRCGGDPGQDVVHGTRETLLRAHGPEMRRARSGSRLWIAGAFVAALGLGATAGPRVLEWWEHITLVLDEEQPDGTHHVVLEDDEGNTVFDDTLQPDEALFQVKPEEEGATPQILHVLPEEDGANAAGRKPR